MQRLKTRSQFQAVLAGRVVAKTAHFSLHCNELHTQMPRAELEKSTGDKSRVAALFPVQSVWMGAMVPKRWAKRAVTRNAIKRQIYAVSADFFHTCPQAAFVVRLRRGFSRQEFPSATSRHLKEAVRAEVIALMQAGCGQR
ncbi:MAG: ribonuclease P protein component [Polaromonas sp.]|nr:MAG: ribonuclease P protein component [Polaromonas sp.]